MKAAITFLLAASPLLMGQSIALCQRATCDTKASI